jgi:hypothetical protein
MMSFFCQPKRKLKHWYFNCFDAIASTTKDISTCYKDIDKEPNKLVIKLFEI